MFESVPASLNKPKTNSHKIKFKALLTGSLAALTVSLSSTASAQVLIPRVSIPSECTTSQTSQTSQNEIVVDCNGTLTRNVNVTNLIGNVTVNIDTTGPANVDLTGQDVTLNILNSATQVTNNSGTSAILIVSTGNVNVTNEVQLSGVSVFGLSLIHI